MPEIGAQANFCMGETHAAASDEVGKSNFTTGRRRRRRGERKKKKQQDEERKKRERRGSAGGKLASRAEAAFSSPPGVKAEGSKLHPSEREGSCTYMISICKFFYPLPLANTSIHHVWYVLKTWAFFAPFKRLM